jgi:uncharacterized protein with von Willebrand factor type A (vWA) domain
MKEILPSKACNGVTRVPMRATWPPVWLQSASTKPPATIPDEPTPAEIPTESMVETIACETPATTPSADEATQPKRFAQCDHADVSTLGIDCSTPYCQRCGVNLPHMREAWIEASKQRQAERSKSL